MPNERILIVDDEKEINDLIRSYLTKEGFQPFSAYNGHEAMELIKKEEMDLIILDVMLPDIEGPNLSLKSGESPTPPSYFSAARGKKWIKSWPCPPVEMIISPNPFSRGS